MQTQGVELGTNNEVVTGIGSLYSIHGKGTDGVRHVQIRDF